MVIGSIVLSSALVHFILVITLVGILIVEYTKKDEKFKAAIIGYIGFLIVIFAFFVLDVYRNIIGASILINWIALFLAFLANVLLILVSFRYFKYINKKLFFSIPLFSVSMVIIEVLRILYVDKSFEIYTAIVAIVATILAYFVIVGFLINTSGEKK